ncbi:HEXXH motif-containing putative peptide modification protein [Streptomyces mirabilis]|nr:HEXXH motif-containing putative peptide modification protein [Streptomyces mirabilis]
MEDLLGYPAVGVWAAHTLRRLRGTAQDDAPSGRTPGTSTRSPPPRPSAPAWSSVPTSRSATAGWSCPRSGRCGCPAGRTGTWPRSAPPRDPCGSPGAHSGPDWHALTELRADGCTVLLDDTDPYRDLRAPAGVEPIDSTAEWQELFGPAWDILRRTDTEVAEALAGGLVSVVPRPRAERFRPHSASSGDAFGTALASAPDDAEQFASTLVHEFQHNKLSAFMHLFTLYDDQGIRLHYAPWRDDPRPLGGLLQGVYAFFGVTAFWRRRGHALGQFEFALWRSQTAYALRAVGSADGLNDLGRRLVAELTRRIEPWLDEPVDARVRTAAALAVADHRATWRACHLRPAPGTLRAHATAWAAGNPLPRTTDEPESAPVPGSPARGIDTRAVLLRWLLADPAGFAALRDDPARWSPERASRTSPWWKAAPPRP